MNKGRYCFTLQINVKPKFCDFAVLRFAKLKPNGIYRLVCQKQLQTKTTQQTNTWSTSIKEALEKGVKYVKR